MLIYKQYDQDALDLQYNNRLQVPGYAMYLEQWELRSRKIEKEHKVIKDIAYGNLSRERLDIYPSSKPNAKTLIFIHGGYWQRLDKSTFHFIAGAFLPYDITIVLITYPLAPTVSLDQIVVSCRKAIYWTYNNISSYGADPNELYIAGHSAGGHLVAMMMTQEYFGENIPATILKGGCAVSGLYNLTPIQLSFVNDVMQMDRNMALRNSPVNLEPEAQCPLLLSAGTDESQEFKDQTKDLYECWKDNLDIELVMLPGLNHYSTTDAIVDMGSPLHLALLQMMNV